MILKGSSYQYCYLEMIYSIVAESANVSITKSLSLFPLWTLLFEGFEDRAGLFPSKLWVHLSLKHYKALRP